MFNFLYIFKHSQNFKRSYYMPKYLIQATYTSEGIKGLLKEGGAGRKKAVEELAKSLGGKVECFYFAFGATDVFSVIDLPDNASVASASLFISSTGTVKINVTVLLTPEELDKVAKIKPQYRAPGK
jgi:uncharacterized protein with GYD domain